jgi:hypothetical protein
MTTEPELKARLIYAFGHLVGSFNPEDPHHGDSADLADDVMNEIGLTDSEREVVRDLAEHVAGNYDYTGEADRVTRQIEAGDL